MHDDKWDDEMRKLFDEVEEEYDPATWQQLSERMDEMDAEEADELFDNTVKKKIDPFYVSSEPRWEEMEAALTTAEDRKNKVIASKTLEGIILLLMFFTLWNYRNHTIPEVTIDNVYVNTITTQSEVIDNVIADIAHDPIVESTSTETNKRITQQLILKKQSTFFKSVISNYIEDQHNSNVHLLPVERGTLETIETRRIEFASVSAAPIKSFNTDFVIALTPAFTSVKDKEDKSKPYNGWTVGLSQSYDVNFVNSDITLGYLGDQIKSGLSGHSTMLTAAHRMGPVEIGSGVGYSAKSFAPGLHTKYQKASANSASFLLSQLDQINFKQIHVPLSVKLFVAPKHKTGFYLVAGVVANVLLETDYVIRRSIQANARPATDPRANIIDLDRPPLGLNNGGNIKENFYASGMIGFGVQSYLNNGVSWFIQPQYQHTLSSDINEVANEINTISFSAGLTFTL